MKFGPIERPAPAENVDHRLQVFKIRSLVPKQKKDDRLEEKLKAYYREADILAMVSHVSSKTRVDVS